MYILSLASRSSAQAANFRVAFLHSNDREEQMFSREVSKLAREEAEYIPHLNNDKKIAKLSQEMNQEEQEWTSTHPLVIDAEQAQVQQGLDEYEARFNEFEKEHPYFSRVEAKIDGGCRLLITCLTPFLVVPEKFEDENAAEKFAAQIGETYTTPERPKDLHRDEKKLVGGSEVLRLKATLLYGQNEINLMAWI